MVNIQNNFTYIYFLFLHLSYLVLKINASLCKGIYLLKTCKLYITYACSMCFAHDLRESTSNKQHTTMETASTARRMHSQHNPFHFGFPSTPNCVIIIYVWPKLDYNKAKGGGGGKGGKESHFLLTYISSFRLKNVLSVQFQSMCHPFFIFVHQKNIGNCNHNSEHWPRASQMAQLELYIVLFFPAVSCRWNLEQTFYPNSYLIPNHFYY